MICNSNTLVGIYTCLSFSPILIIVVLWGIIAEKVYGISATKITKSNSSYNYKEQLLWNTLFPNLEWLKLADTRRLANETKILSNVQSIPQIRPFNRANLIHSHGTRGHDYNFVIPKPNTNFLKNIVSNIMEQYYGIRYPNWN